MKIEVYLQVVFVLCCCTFVEICSQAPGANLLASSCTVSINRTGDSLELCSCNSSQRCTQTCFKQSQECIQLEQVDRADTVECNWVLGSDQQVRYCFSNCPSLNDMSGCISTEISPCLGRRRNMTVTINCLVSTPTVPLPVVTPTKSHIQTDSSALSGSKSSIRNDLSMESLQSVSPTVGSTTDAIPLPITTRAGSTTSTSVMKQEQSSLLATSMSPTSESVPSVTRENIAPTSTLQPRHITSTVQQQGRTTTFQFNTIITTKNQFSTTIISSEAVIPTATVSDNGMSTSPFTVPHPSTTADNMFITQTTTDVTSATRPIPSESPIITMSVQPDQNTITAASVSVTENPTLSIMTTATPALPPTMSTNQVSTVGTVLLTTHTVTTSNPTTKTKTEEQKLSPLALTLISVFGGLSVVIALATGITLFLICYSSRKKQKSYIVRNGLSHTEPVYSEVFEPEGGRPDQPHLYESMTRYMLPSYSKYKKKRYLRKAGNPSNNTVQITISDTHEVTPGNLPLPTSNGTAEAHLSGLSQGSNLQVDSYIPNPYETPVSSLGDLRDQEGYAQVRDSSSTASPAIGQISSHGYCDIRPVTIATRSYSLGDVRNGYVNVRDALAPRIYESIHSSTKVFRSKGYVNVRKYHVLSRSYSLDDIRNRPYVNVPPPSPLGDIKLGGYTDASSRKPKPRSYESPVGSMEDIKDGGYSTVSPPRPRSYESPVLSLVSEGSGSTTGESCCCDEPNETLTDGGYSKLDTSLLDGYAILEPYIPGRNNIYSHLQYNI